MVAYKDEERGTWYVSFHYNDWTGKNKRKLKRGFRTKKQALEYEQKFLLQQATNLDMRFEVFYKLYEEDLKPKLKLNTWRTKKLYEAGELIGIHLLDHIIIGREDAKETYYSMAEHGLLKE